MTQLLQLLSVMLCLISNGFSQSQSQSKCNRERNDAQNRNGVGGYTPECEWNGEYKAKQCHYSAATCWCSTADGERIPGTQGQSFDPRIQQLDCGLERQRYLSTSGLQQQPSSSSGGQCPLPTFGRVCNSRQDFCLGDASCTTGQKCCFNGCYNECQWTSPGSSGSNSVNSATVSNSFWSGGSASGSSRGGTCPTPSGFGSCLQACQSDTNCPSGSKCCFNGCGQECKQVAGGGGSGVDSFRTDSSQQGRKPGECPNPTGFGTCVASCQDDSNCPGQQRCCSNGCGHECLNPAGSSGNFQSVSFGQGSKPGVCPRPLGNGACINGCSSDSDCPSSQKCCSNGCGRVCSSPTDVGFSSSDPCASNPCPFGQTCIARVSPCFNTPCQAYECRSNSNSGGSSFNPNPNSVGSGQCTDPNAVFDECNAYPSCQDSCDTLGQARACPAVCVSGCICRPGYVRRSLASEQCVQRTQCNTFNPSASPVIGGFGSAANILVVTQAVAVVTGNPNNPNIQGTVTFSQSGGIGPVSVTGNIKGLTSGQHGFHVHEYGDIGNGCVNAGTHFNPDNLQHGGQTDFSRHAGDLGNINADSAGSADINIQDGKISLNGPYSIIGRAVVIHEKADDNGKGQDDESKKTGNAGSRLACGIVAIKATQPPGSGFGG